MKKGLFRLLAILTIILLTASPVYAAERSLSLVSISFIHGKGVVFTFEPTGDFKLSELTGYAIVNGKKFPLSCRFNDFGQVKCGTGTSLSQYIGLIASGEIAGFSYSGLIREGGSKKYCTSLWEQDNQDWIYTTICGAVPPSNGDWILMNDGITIAYYNASGPAGPGFYPEN